MPAESATRIALYRWCFNTKQRDSAPQDVGNLLSWVVRSGLPLSALAHDVALAQIGEARAVALR